MLRALIISTIFSLVMTPPTTAKDRESIDSTNSQTQIVVLVRHAEKEEVGKDPSLSQQGVDRAKQLAAILTNTPLSLLLSSPLKRTQETLIPTAQERDIAITTIDFSTGLDAHVDKHVEMIHSHPGNILVVGHSNTIPMIINALGGPEVKPIAEDNYSNIYYIRISNDKTVTLQQSQNGSDAN